MSDDDLGGRLPLLDPAGLSPDRRRFHDAAMAEQHPWSLDVGFQLVTSDQRLIGPYNAFLRRPQTSERFQQFASAAAQGATLTPQLREVVILAVGSTWGADYEVYAHRLVALGAGVPAADADAMASGHPPEHLGPDAATAFALVQQLTAEHRVDQSLYERALTAFGEEGLVDVVALAGAYLMVSATLTLFDVPAPAATPQPTPDDTSIRDQKETS